MKNKLGQKHVAGVTGYGWLRVVTCGFGWLHVVTGVTGGYGAKGGNLLHSHLPSECDYLQSTRVYGDYQLIIAINSGI